jgi:D-alanyl-D-alanine carboxypeptidase
MIKNNPHRFSGTARGLAAALVILVVGLAAQDAGARSQPSLRKQLARLVSVGSPGAILYVRHGDRAVTLTSGFANRDRRTPMRGDATFRIGSLTKTQVATVVLQLAGEGKLSLDATVSDYLPGLIPAGEKITIQELLNHTSGVPEFDSDPKVLAPYLHGNLGYRWSPRKLVQIAASHRRPFAPGAKYSYSNTNYLVLGLIIEKVTGNSLAHVLRARIYRPLGVRRTSLQTSAEQNVPEMHGYYTFGKPPAADITALSPYPWASGAVVSNAADVAHFYRALLTGRLLAPQLLRSMQTTVSEGGDIDYPGERYGLGIESYPTRCGTAWGHGGNFPGYLVYAFTSADGAKQAELAVNEDPTSLPERVGPMFKALLVSAYCAWVR